MQINPPRGSVLHAFLQRSNGQGRVHRRPLSFLGHNGVFTPDDLMTKGVGVIKSNAPVMIYDDDRFYMASVLAEMIAAAGHEVVFVTPSPIVAAWSENTLEQVRIQTRLIELGVEIIPTKKLSGMDSGAISLKCVYSNQTQTIECGSLVLVTSRVPENTLWSELTKQEASWLDAGIKSVTRIGDCLTPSLIANAVQSGHAYAQAAGYDEIPEPKREDYGRV